MNKAIKLLDQLNSQYLKLHKNYEELFWASFMGDHSVDKHKDTAMAKRDAFRASPEYPAQIRALLPEADAKTRQRLTHWLKFFDCYQTPVQLLALKKKIDQLESLIHKKLASRKEGYTDPKTKRFVAASIVKMRTMIRTNSEEVVRKACFEACEQLAGSLIQEYIQLVGLRNQYARSLGYQDFYDYKVQREDGMTKAELFGLFEEIYQKTKYAFKDLRRLEKLMPGLRQPWNFSYLLAGDFTKEEDPYFQFSEAVPRWGLSFAAMGINFQGGKLKLDLLDRKGKYNNGFCHWPDLVHFKNGRLQPASTNFTCTLVPGQVGSGIVGFTTLFHEGGHAAHLLNSKQTEVCINSEYPPMMTAWAETQSMFLDTVFSSIEWKTRYAKNADGQTYPFDLFERKVRRLHWLWPLSLGGISFVSEFEKKIYETKQLTPDKVFALARQMHRKYFDYRTDSLAVLNVPHLYSWESSGSYHNYGLATLALEQWRAYFLKKYGHIVDNPKVGREMSKVWALGASKNFKEFVKLATGKKLSAGAYLEVVTRTPEQAIRIAKQRIARLAKVKSPNGPVNLGASIAMVHGKEVIATNAERFETMTNQYRAWLKRQESKHG